MGNGNAALGFGAGENLTTGQNNIAIGNPGVTGESGIVRVGTEGTQTAVYMAGMTTSALAEGVPVGVSPTGQLGVKRSLARFKEVIKPMNKASEAIFSLQPVTFRYKKDIDPKGTPQFGLVAEEVEKIDSALVAHDEKGQPFTVRYEEVNAMLLNEFLKEHRKVEVLEASLAQQQKTIEALSAVSKSRRRVSKLSTQIATSSRPRAWSRIADRVLRGRLESWARPSSISAGAKNCARRLLRQRLVACPTTLLPPTRFGTRTRLFTSCM